MREQWVEEDDAKYVHVDAFNEAKEKSEEIDG